jgi:hypothetical protein
MPVSGTLKREIRTMKPAIHHLFLLFSTITIALLSSCSEDDNRHGRIEFAFSHEIDDDAAVWNQLIYTNAAGNNYEVKEVQWFISDIALTRSNDAIVRMEDDFFTHYIDTNIPSTLSSKVKDNIPSGDYKSVTFTFGLRGEKNTPGMFPDLPESNMIWPYAIGGDQGGYHYMKLNGFWINTQEQRVPFNFHLGVGQIYNYQNEVTEFVQNWFEVTIPINFTVSPGENQVLDLVMMIDSWFATPFIYDHNQYGSMIMTNQEALGKIKANGVDAFKIREKNSGL